MFPALSKVDAKGCRIAVASALAQKTRVLLGREQLLLRIGLLSEIFLDELAELHQLCQLGVAGMDSEVVLYALSKVWDADERTFEKVFRLAAGLSDEKRNRLLPMVVNYLQSHFTHNRRISYETIAQIEEQTLPKRKRSMLSYFDEIKNESLKIGEKRGEKKASEKIAENLIRDGMEISKICQHTGLRRKQVEQIQNNLQRH